MVEEKQPDLPLDEVMLAMDVVDTLRHRELLVSRELNSDARDQSLITRLRELYASQGIEVPDRILAEGVEALKEERFSYVSPVQSWQTRLAGIYVARGKWLRRLGLLLAAAAIIWGAYYLLVVRPANQQLDTDITALHSHIEDNAGTLTGLEEKQSMLARRLSGIEYSAGDELGTSFEHGHRAASEALDLAAENLERASGIDFSTPLKRSNFDELSRHIKQGLTQQKDYLDQAAIELQEAGAAIDGLELLYELPLKLQAEYGAIEQIARDKNALVQAEQLYHSALAALQAGDSAAADSVYTALAALRSTLSLSYRLRIVSRPDEYSGVWRIPDDNPAAKNYYLIVEAIAEDGSVLTLPVVNEEDGEQYRVNRWGIRVDEKLFNSVTQDKQDDGIIQMREVGRKQSGYLQAEFSIDTPGSSITSW